MLLRWELPAVCTVEAGIKSVGLFPDGRNVLGIDVVNERIVRLSWLGHREFLSVNFPDDILPEINHQFAANTN